MVVAGGHASRDLTRQGSNDTQEVHANKACAIKDFHHNIGGTMSQLAPNLLIRIGSAPPLGKLAPVLHSFRHGNLVVLHAFVDTLLVGGSVDS